MFAKAKQAKIARMAVISLLRIEEQNMADRFVSVQNLLNTEAEMLRKNGVLYEKGCGRVKVVVNFDELKLKIFITPDFMYSAVVYCCMGKPLLLSENMDAVLAELTVQELKNILGAYKDFYNVMPQVI